MGKSYEGAGNIELLGYEIISLISKGKKETQTDVIQCMWESRIVKYLREKYKNEMMFLGTSDLYNYDDWEKIFFQSSHYTQNDARKKLGIVNEEDGLLLLLQIVLEAVAQRQ